MNDEPCDETLQLITDNKQWEQAIMKYPVYILYAPFKCVLLKKHYTFECHITKKPENIDNDILLQLAQMDITWSLLPKLFDTCGLMRLSETNAITKWPHLAKKIGCSEVFLEMVDKDILTPHLTMYKYIFRYSVNINVSKFAEQCYLHNAKSYGKMAVTMYLQYPYIVYNNLPYYEIEQIYDRCKEEEKNIAILNSAMLYGEDDTDLVLERKICMEYVNNYDLTNFPNDPPAHYNPHICARAVAFNKNNIWLAKLYDDEFYVECENKLVTELQKHLSIIN